VARISLNSSPTLHYWIDKTKRLLRLVRRNGWAVNFAATNWTSWTLALSPELRIPKASSVHLPVSLPVATRTISLTYSPWRSLAAFTACVRNKRTVLQNRDDVRFSTPLPPHPAVCLAQRTRNALRFEVLTAMSAKLLSAWRRVGGTCSFRRQGRRVSRRYG
jgi:hypothetical protein